MWTYTLYCLEAYIQTHSASRKPDGHIEVDFADFCKWMQDNHLMGLVTHSDNRDCCLEGSAN